MSRILIVDDEPRIREMTKKFLRSTDHIVDLAEDGVVALEMFEANQYDLAVVDLKMPKMNGESLIKSIRQKDKHVAIIVLTGHGDWDTAYQMLKDYQISEFLNKPLPNPGQFVFNVENSLETSQLRTHMEEMVQSKTAKLAKSEQKFRSLIEFIPIPVSLINETGSIDYHNNKFIDTFGFSLENVSDLDSWARLTLLSEKERKSFITQISQRIREAFKTDAEVAPLEIVLYNYKGQKKIVQLMIAPVGEVGVIVSNDLTLIKQRELELKKANEAAQLAIEARSLFMAKMSHEIRTPMNGVMGFLQLVLGRDKKLTLGTREYLEIALQSSRNLNKIIDDILDLSKIDSGKYVIENNLFNISDALHKMIILHSVAAVEKGLSLEIEIDSDLASHYYGDQMRLNQILNNLIGNAIKFTESGGIIVKATQSVLPDLIQIAVQDTGPGISNENLEKIFMPFEQADDSISRTYGGTGLGTTIARQLVELMGGKLWVESEIGKGSTFYFTMQLAKKTESIPIV